MPSSESLLAALVGFDSTSALSNRAIIDFIADYLAGYGVQAHILPNEDGSKANLWATVGPATSGGVCLSGHSDVVPVAGQPWSSAPFTLTKRDGRLYGRGTCDMKGFIACALAAVPAMVEAPLIHPIHFAFSYDEEVGCLGAPHMIAQIGQHLPRPALVVVGEPTMMRVVSAHKGMWSFECHVRGHEAHSSQTHRGVSAVMTGARLVAKLDEMARSHAAAAKPDCPFEPPYSSIHVGLIKGGTAVNIISRDCHFICDIRYLPEDDPQAIQQELADWAATTLLPDMQKISPECQISITPHHHVPALCHDPASPAEQLARAITGDNGILMVPYATEAGQFQQAGLPAIICGPGSIDQAHQADEYVALDQLYACDHFMEKVIAFCRNDGAIAPLYQA